MPITPRSNSLSTSARGIFACSSISRTSGRTCASANSRMLSRRIRSSSLRSVRAGLVMTSKLMRTILSHGAGPQVRLRPALRRQKCRYHPMMRRLTAFVLAACAAALGVSLSAAPNEVEGQQPPQQQQPVIRSGINFIRVDVLVTDRKTGKPVTDLKESDFEVVEDNRPQTVETFRLIDMDVPTDGEMADAAPIRSLDQQEREMLRDDVRVIAILDYDYHVLRGNVMVIREKLASFVLHLNPRDLVAVVYPLTPVSVLVFTRNHESFVNVIMIFQGRKFD